MELCVDEMPWHGVTNKELNVFSHLMKFLNNIKNAFPDIKYTKNADSIVDNWTTNKDFNIMKKFNKASIRENSFNITNFYSSEGGLA